MVGRGTLTRILVAGAIMGGIITSGVVSGGGGPPPPPGSFNLFLVASGGTASPTRLSSPTDFASAPSSAKCSSIQACFTAANSGDQVQMQSGSYSSQSITSGTKTTTNPVVFAGTRANVSFSGLTIGSTAGTTTPQGMTISGFNTGSTTIRGSNFVTLDDFDANTGYWAGTQRLTVSRCFFDANRTSADVIDVYEEGAIAGTEGLTVDSCTITGGGFTCPPCTHPDGFQFSNTGTNSDNGVHASNVTIKNNKFIDNMCTNIRTNPRETNMVFENNVFFDPIPDSDPNSPCGYTASFEYMSSATMRNNTFAGGQPIQMTPVWSGIAPAYSFQDWYNNAGVSFSAGCRGGEAATGVQSHNRWTSQSCGGTNTQGSLGINSSTGVPNAGSFLINNGDTSVFTATDLNGVARPIGSAPDIGAFEVG